MTLEPWQWGLSLIIIAMPMLVANIWWLIFNRKRRNGAPIHQEYDLRTSSFLAGVTAGMAGAASCRHINCSLPRYHPEGIEHTACPGDLP